MMNEFIYALGNNLTEIFNEIKELVLPIPIPIEAAFKIHIPQRGDKRNLLLLSKKNAIAKKNELLKAEHLKDPDVKINYILNQLSLIWLSEVPYTWNVLTIKFPRKLSCCCV